MPGTYREWIKEHGTALARRFAGSHSVTKPVVAAADETPRQAPRQAPRLPELVQEIIAPIEADTAIATRRDAIRALRRLGLDDFGALLLSMPNPEFPRLSALLPSMASQEVQQNWTGSSGIPLLKQTLNFVRSMAYHFVSHTGRSLTGATALDYGCGYGRIARAMYYFVDEPDLFCVDPWDASIKLCRQAGLGENFRQSDYLPRDLPVGDVRFDLIYAFSVFTHLSERATFMALSTLRRYIKEDGLLVITIRPIEYWGCDPDVSPEETLRLERAHRTVGFSFRPHSREPVDGDITYGDTTLTPAWLAQRCRGWARGWAIVGLDRSLEDPLQIYVYLRPARS